jgi:hypothetical protein
MLHAYNVTDKATTILTPLTPLLSPLLLRNEIPAGKQHPIIALHPRPRTVGHPHADGISLTGRERAGIDSGMLAITGEERKYD